MKLPFLLTSILGLSCLPADEARPPDELDKKIYKTIIQPTPDKADASWITGALRDEVIDRMLRIVAEPTPDMSRHNANVVLVQLNHVPTIRTMLARNAAGEGDDASFLGTFAPVAALPYMMDALDEASTVEPPPESNCVGTSSPRQDLGTAVLKRIYRNDKIPKETRDWAERFISVFAMRPEVQTEVIKKFWEKNREALMQARYADVTFIPEFTVVHSKAYEKLRAMHAEEAKRINDRSRPPVKESE
jgi:hypothetical protein